MRTIREMIDEDDALRHTRFNDPTLLCPFMRARHAALMDRLKNLNPFHDGRPGRFWTFETWRSPSRQIELYDQGRTKTLCSAHNYGCAFDIVAVDCSKDISGTGWTWEGVRWDELDYAVKQIPGLSRIGNWDRPHVQHHLWQTDLIHKLGSK